MIKKISYGFVMLAALVSASTTYAGVTPRVSLGLHGGDWDFSGDTILEIEGDLVVATLGGSLLFDGGYYTSLAIGHSEEDAVERFQGSGNSYNTELEYEQTSLTFGNVDESGLSWFVGYQDKTVSSVDNNAGSEIEIDISGVFFGFGKYFPLTQGGVNLSLGFGFMEGEINTSGFFASNTSDEADFAFGGSIGLGYSYPINKNISVAADIKWQRYSLDYEDFNAEIDEDLLLYGVSLNYSFTRN